MLKPGWSYGMRLDTKFFRRDALVVAPELLGKFLVRRFANGEIIRCRIVEVEVYLGQDDLACHASRGRTNRTEVMFAAGGVVYVYLIYGMYWLLNIVTGKKAEPQAILIRGIEGVDGPGRVGRILDLDKSFYGENLTCSDRLWLEGDGQVFDFSTHPRIGVQSSGEYWSARPWRYVLIIS